MISLAGEGQAEHGRPQRRARARPSRRTTWRPSIAGTVGGLQGRQRDRRARTSRGPRLFSLPLVVILSLLIFGSVVAALMPAVVGAIAVLGALAVVRLITELHRGLGVLDQRDHPARHRPRDRLRAVRDQPVPRGAGPAARRTIRRRPAKAIRVTMATAGRTVLFSGLTVAAAMSSLLIFPQNFLRSLGYGGIAAVLVAVVAALTVLPGDPAAARPPHRRRPAAVAPAPSRRGRQRPRRLGAARPRRDAPPGPGDGRRRGCAAVRRLALPRREVGLGRLPGAASGQPGPRRRGHAQRGLRPGAVDREHPARDRRTRPRWRRTPTRSRRSTASSTYARSPSEDGVTLLRASLGRQQPDPGVAGRRRARSATSPARTARTSWSVA